MTQILKRALPFILTFVFGVMITAIIGRLSPIRQTGFFDNGRSHCNWKSRTVHVWELRDPGTVLHMSIPVKDSHSPILTAKEPALLLRAQHRQKHESRKSEPCHPIFLPQFFCLPDAAYVHLAIIAHSTFVSAPTSCRKAA